MNTTAHARSAQGETITFMTDSMANARAAELRRRIRASRDNDTEEAAMRQELEGLYEKHPSIRPEY